ncbi:MAG: hypothetical protein MJZ33_13110 [Paludibacteraceae bacterium]|nr:hypothetical protein [Paludibacteraceae bacterium]
MNDLINYYTNAEWGNVKDRILFERKTPNGTFELVVEIDYVKKILSGVSFRIKT